MQEMLTAHNKTRNQIRQFYQDCLDKSVNRIKRTFEMEHTHNMILKLGDVAGIKGLLPPYCMGDLVNAVWRGLQKAGIVVHRCKDPYDLLVEWGSVLRRSEQSSKRIEACDDVRKQQEAVMDAKVAELQYLTSDDLMLDMLANPAKCKTYHRLAASARG
jgi:hypothetical protein